MKQLLITPPILAALWALVVASLAMCAILYLRVRALKAKIRSLEAQHGLQLQALCVLREMVKQLRSLSV